MARTFKLKNLDIDGTDDANELKYTDSHKTYWRHNTSIALHLVVACCSIATTVGVYLTMNAINDLHTTTKHLYLATMSPEYDGSSMASPHTRTKYTDVLSELNGDNSGYRRLGTFEDVFWTVALPVYTVSTPPDCGDGVCCITTATGSYTEFLGEQQCYDTTTAQITTCGSVYTNKNTKCPN